MSCSAVASPSSPQPSDQSVAAQFAALPPAEREAFLASLSPEQARALAYDWRFWARPNQLLPGGEWIYWLLLAGRGFGKSRTGAETVRMWEQEGAKRIALVAPTAGDARDVMVEGESGLLAIYPDDEKPLYEPSKRRITWKSGCIAQLFSAEEPERLRGPQFEKAWCDELAAWKYAQETWDMLMFGLRLGDKPQAVITTTPKPVPLVKDLIKDPSTLITRGSTYDNKANLAATFLKKITAKYEGTRLGRQELNAEVLDDVEGALWTIALIDSLRVRTALRLDDPYEMLAAWGHCAALERIVVAVDPNVGGTDECGIVVAGVGLCTCKGTGAPERHAFILADLSAAMGPNEWLRAVVGAYRQHTADRIVAEVNQGGKLVEVALRTVDERISYRAVHASRGKVARAEPVAALYEQGKVHHVGAFPKLEDQLTQYVPAIATKSPDRLDALVWAITELLLAEPKREVRVIRHQAAPPRR